VQFTLFVKVRDNIIYNMCHNEDGWIVRVRSVWRKGYLFLLEDCFGNGLGFLHLIMLYLCSKKVTS